MKSTHLKKILIIVVIVILVILFFVLDLGQYLSLTYIKASQLKFQALYNDHTFLVLGGYFLLYILVVALNLPGAAIMTLAGGGLFGFWTGLVVISFASSIGATFACLVARYLLGNVVQSRFGDKLIKLNEGIEREGPFYLFTMRLIPAIPFFAINLMMGLTKMPLRTFYIVSQIGMLPGTMVFVNAGKELAKIDSASGILSPTLWISFILLGIFPIAVKKIIQFYRTRTGKTEATDDNSDTEN